MSNQDILVRIPVSLNSTYDSIIPTITIRVYDFTLGEVHGILSSHEHLLQLKSTEIIAATLPSINIVGRERPFASNFNRRGRGGRSGQPMLMNVTNTLIIDSLRVLLS
ncbi:hypothetical protein AXF42_Ash018296 [Apostasia shenzhenica]|uniref:Uncharacterized protein n=1 Tax=Apostasia shenzhenica TaxID=1088818 RepID=A0A2I0B2P8_9ASPA|nr:hypothetical protein AXF42_Ash018296 [Apostasia shenzhenica]